MNESQPTAPPRFTFRTPILDLAYTGNSLAAILTFRTLAQLIRLAVIVVVSIGVTWAVNSMIVEGALLIWPMVVVLISARLTVRYLKPE